MNTIDLLLVGGAMPSGIALISVFFFSVHFSFCVAIKKKSEQIKLNTYLIQKIKFMLL